MLKDELVKKRLGPSSYRGVDIDRINWKRGAVRDPSKRPSLLNRERRGVKHTNGWPAVPREYFDQE